MLSTSLICCYTSANVCSMVHTGWPQIRVCITVRLSRWYSDRLAGRLACRSVGCSYCCLLAKVSTQHATHRHSQWTSCSPAKSDKPKPQSFAEARDAWEVASAKMPDEEPEGQHCIQMLFFTVRFIKLWYDESLLSAHLTLMNGWHHSQHHQ